MKKFFYFLLFVSLIIVLTIILKKDDQKSAFRLLPEKTFIAFQITNPYETWNEVKKHRLWQDLRSIDAMHNVNTLFATADSLINSNRTLTKIFGSSEVLISLHSYDDQIIHPLLIYDMNKYSGVSKIFSYISSVAGNDIDIIEKEYEGIDFYTLSYRPENVLLYFTQLNNRLILSSNPQLVENVIRKYKLMDIYIDHDLEDVFTNLKNKSDFEIFVNIKHLKKYLASELSINLEKEFPATKYMQSVGFNIELNQKGIILEGISKVTKIKDPLIKSIISSDNRSFKIHQAIPSRIASFVTYNVSGFKNLKTNLSETDDETNKDYIELIEKLEKTTGIDLYTDLLNWIEDEIAILQTEPTNLGRDNELALVVQGKNAKVTSERMDNLSMKIKKNTPVKFKHIVYGEYEINYLAIPGIFKALFGNLISELEKPYYVVIGKYVYFSNHPQTLKNIIDDFQKDHILLDDNRYLSFVNTFKPKGILYSYIKPPVFYSNLVRMSKESNSLYSFEKPAKKTKHIGIDIRKEKDILYSLHMMIDYGVDIQEYTPKIYSSKDMFWIYDSLETEKNAVIDTLAPVILIDDLDAKEFIEYYDSVTIRLKVELKNGLKHGRYREYYKTGELKVKGKYKNDKRQGKWEYFSEEGDEIKQISF